ncbi:MAG: cytochrome P450 [Novosphingobium sp.]
MTAQPDFYSDPDVIADPRSYFEAMRAQAPIVKEPFHGTVMVTGYDAALEVLVDKQGVFSNACSVVGPIPGLPFMPEGPDIKGQLGVYSAQMPWADHLVCFDGKKHAEHRMLLGSLLTYKRLKQNEAYLHELSEMLIDRFVARCVCDIVPEFGHATTVYAISDLMGIPMADRALLLEQIGAPPSQVAGDAPLKVGSDPLAAMKPLFDTYLRERQEKPCGDLMSDLVQAKFKDGTGPDFDTLSHLACFLFGAGQDTTSRLIAMAVLVLAEQPDLQERLRAEPRRIPDFIEEVLRYDGPVKVAYRLATVDTKVGDVDIPAGTILTICYSAASNDQAKFAEPDSIDIDRAGLRDHMGFGKGAHGCLGAPLGRMESRIAIEHLLGRVRNIRISEQHHGPAGARRYNFEPTYSFRSLSDLHIEFDPA